MKRRLIALILMSIMTVFNFGGCSNNDGNDNNVADNSVVEEEIVVEEDVPLKFPDDRFTMETVNVKTKEGEKVVEYKYYSHICYVSKPINSDYQSLNVKVPVSINGVEIDASNAPILFKNLVNEYMSVINVEKVDNQNQGGGLSDSADLALASGYVVVEPGCRGRDNKAEDGTYYGKAPAAIVDLKAAIRYIRYNKDLIPGNKDWIIASGMNSGGALSALLGVSGDSKLYEDYLKDIGAAEGKDNIFASASFSPITDLEHSDMAYEWMFGKVPLSNGNLVDQEISKNLIDEFSAYQDYLNIKGKEDFGYITSDNLKDYLLLHYLKPSADRFISTLPEGERSMYLNNNPWISWVDDSSSFTFEDFVQHVGRDKDVPAFDDFALKTPENILFGDSEVNARHFTAFSAQKNIAEGGNTIIDDDLRNSIDLMNPMYFVNKKDVKCADYWWMRQGSKDSSNSLAILNNLATSLENNSKDVDVSLYWDEGKGANDDAEEFIDWISNITGYSVK